MKTIRRFGNIVEASFARSLLVAAGIEANIAEECVGTLAPWGIPWGMRLQVPEEDEERALKLLAKPSGLAAQDPGAETEGAVAAELEAPPPAAELDKDRSLTCPECGTGWELSPEEAERETFLCGECGTAIKLINHAAVTVPMKANEPAGGWWAMLLPRSPSRWAFVIVMVAFTHLAGSVWSGILNPFIPQYPFNFYAAHGWPATILHLFNSIVWTPIWETAIFAGIIECFRKAHAPPWLQVVPALAVLCCIDGQHWWSHGLEVVPGFAIMGLTYLYWRKVSWGNAVATVMALHGLFNGSLEVRRVANQIHRDAVSSPYASDDDRANADAIYQNAVALDFTGNDTEEIKELQKAIQRYPYEPYYFYHLGSVYRHQHKLVQAEAAFRKSIALDGNDWMLWDALAYALSDERRYKEAADAAQKAVELAPDSRKAEVDHMTAYIRTFKGTSR